MNQMLNKCKDFGNYFGVQSFLFTFAVGILTFPIASNERENYIKSNGSVFKARF
jgi:hypothetical protein